MNGKRQQQYTPDTIIMLQAIITSSMYVCMYSVDVGIQHCMGKSFINLSEQDHDYHIQHNDSHVLYIYITEATVGD